MSVRTPHRAAALLVAAALLFAACGGGDEAATGGSGDGGDGGGAPDDLSESPPDLPTVRLSIGADEGSLTPYTFAFGYPGRLLLGLLYDTLLVKDAANELQPLLATDYSSDDSGQEWSITIRDDAAWHDGTPLTADDVAFTFEYAARQSRGPWTAGANDLDSIAVDGQTITISLTRPVPDFVYRLADVEIIPRHVWADVDDPTAASAELAVGSGPFTLAEYRQDQFYRFEVNPEYALGTPQVGEIVVSVIPEPSTTFAAVSSGELDATTVPLEPQLVETFAGDGIELVSGASYAPTLLQLNAERAPFDDPAFRAAMAAAIDPSELIDIVMLDQATAPNAGFTHPESPFGRSAIDHVHDPELAAELLDAAGYPLEGDVRVDPSGEPVSLELLVYASRPLRIRTAELIAEQLGAVGIAVQVTPLDAETVDDFVWPGFDVSEGRDFDAAIWGWSAPVMLEAGRLGSLVHSDPARGSLNVGGYRSDAADAIVDELVVTAEPSRVDELITELVQLIATDRPFVTLYYEDRVFPFRPAAYDGWVFRAGDGIVQKLSFVDYSI